MNHHALKTVQPFYNDVEQYLKTFEVRANDRNYSVGDILTLQEFPYTGRELKKEVGYVLSHDDFPQGLKEGYVVLGLIDIPCTQDTRDFDFNYQNYGTVYYDDELDN